MKKKSSKGTEQFFQLISGTFPPIQFAFGYGSAFFKQKNHENQKVLFLVVKFNLNRRNLSSTLFL